MKKLVFMLTAVAMAATTTAATVNWTCSNVKDSSGNGVSGIAYFLTTDMLSYSDAQALAGKGVDAFTAAIGSAYSYTGSAGAFGKSSPGIANATLGLENGTEYTAYLMIFNTDTITTDSSYYLTATKSLLTLSGADDAAAVKFGSQSTPSQADGAWSSVKGADPDPGPLPTPEPTSGLLMLIGAAGLALRRKRA